MRGNINKGIKMYMRVYYHQAFYIVIVKHHSLPDAMKIAINPKWILKEACLWFPLRCGKRQTCWSGFIIATYEQAKLHVWGQVVTGCSACSNYNLPTHVVARLWLLFSKYNICWRFGVPANWQVCRPGITFTIVLQHLLDGSVVDHPHRKLSYLLTILLFFVVGLDLLRFTFWDLNALPPICKIKSVLKSSIYVFASFHLIPHM